MSQSINQDLGQLGEIILENAQNRLTGKISVTFHMKQGGIGRINVVVDKDLKLNGKALKDA